MIENPFVRHGNLRRQAELLLAAGFAQEIHKTQSEYFIELVKASQSITEPWLGQQLGRNNLYLRHVLVEPRIPFARQAQLLQIEVHPSVLLESENDKKFVYVVSGKTFKDGFSIADIATKLPPDFRPANPEEGIVDFASILTEEGFSAFPGRQLKRPKGLIPSSEPPLSVVCLDRFLGRPRIIEMDLNDTDRSIGVFGVLT